MHGAAPKIMDAWELATQYKVQDLRERVIKEVRPGGQQSNSSLFTSSLDA